MLCPNTDRIGSYLVVMSIRYICSKITAVIIYMFLWCLSWVFACLRMCVCVGFHSWTYNFVRFHTMIGKFLYGRSSFWLIKMGISQRLHGWHTLTWLIFSQGLYRSFESLGKKLIESRWLDGKKLSDLEKIWPQKMEFFKTIRILEGKKRPCRKGGRKFFGNMFFLLINLAISLTCVFLIFSMFWLEHQFCFETFFHLIWKKSATLSDL